MSDFHTSVRQVMIYPSTDQNIHFCVYRRSYLIWSAAIVYSRFEVPSFYIDVPCQSWYLRLIVEGEDVRRHVKQRKTRAV